MQHLITAMIAHMARSHTELARIIEAKRDTIIHASQLVTSIPDRHMSFDNVEDITTHTQAVIKTLPAYLNSLADLEQSMAESLSVIMKEITPAPQEEEE